MRLTRAQRNAIFDGQAPPITGTGKCPVEPGHVQELSRLVTLKVVKVRPRKAGGWSLMYEIHDRRDPVRIMRPAPPATPVDEPVLVPDDEAGENVKAAQESAYTSMPTYLSSGGEGVSRKDQIRITDQAHRNQGQQQAVNEARREQHELEQRLGRVRRDAALRGMNMELSSQMRVLERMIAQLERKVYGKAA